MTGVQTCALPICFPVTIGVILYKPKLGDQNPGGGGYFHALSDDGSCTHLKPAGDIAIWVLDPSNNISPTFTNDAFGDFKIVFPVTIVSFFLDQMRYSSYLSGFEPPKFPGSSFSQQHLPYSNSDEPYTNFLHMDLPLQTQIPYHKLFFHTFQIVLALQTQ